MENAIFLMKRRTGGECRTPDESSMDRVGRITEGCRINDIRIRNKKNKKNVSRMSVVIFGCISFTRQRERSMENRTSDKNYRSTPRPTTPPQKNRKRLDLQRRLKSADSKSAESAGVRSRVGAAWGSSTRSRDAHQHRKRSGEGEA